MVEMGEWLVGGVMVGLEA